MTLLSAIRQADAVQCCKGRAYSSTAPLISSPEARAQLVTLLSGGGHPTDSVNFDPDTVPFLRISGGPGDGAVFAASGGRGNVGAKPRESVTVKPPKGGSVRIPEGCRHFCRNRKLHG